MKRIIFGNLQRRREVMRYLSQIEEQNPEEQFRKKDTIQKRKRGRPRKPRSVPQADPEALRDAVKEIRKMAKEYSNGDLLFDVQYIEKNRPRLLKNAGISVRDSQETWKVPYNQENTAMLTEKDQILIRRYLSSREKIGFLRQSVDRIPTPQTRKIAIDVLLKGSNILDLTYKYGLSSRTLWRRKKEILEGIAIDYIKR